MGIHSIDGLPWLTFLLFFDVFADASELVAAGLPFEGDVLCGGLVSGATLALSASLCSVILTGEAPLDRRAASVIQCGKWVGRSRMLFSEMRRLMCATTGVSSRIGAPKEAKQVQKRQEHVLGRTTEAVVEVKAWRRCSFKGTRAVNVCGRVLCRTEGRSRRNSRTYLGRGGEWHRQTF